jgi:hypothetical protein
VRVDLGAGGDERAEAGGIDGRVTALGIGAERARPASLNRRRRW